MLCLGAVSSTETVRLCIRTAFFFFLFFLLLLCLLLFLLIVVVVLLVLCLACPGDPGWVTGH